MKFSLTFLVRLIGLVGVAVTATAVCLSRVTPEARDLRDEAPSRFLGVNGPAVWPGLGGNLLLDTETGGLTALVPGGEVGRVLDLVTFSPWNRGRNELEAVGRTVFAADGQSESEATSTGLVRFTVPGGVVTGRVSLDTAVMGRPCWLPNRRSVVLFPTGDGGLHVHDFSADGAPEPRPVVWACDTPGRGVAMIGDPVAPVIPALGGRVLVTLRRFIDDGGRRRVVGSEVWWLRLDPDGREVRAAGRLTTGNGPASDERLPNIAATPDGRLAFAYLQACPSDDNDWHLKLAEVVVDPATGAPSVGPRGVRDLGGWYAPTLPAFSADGRWLYALPRSKIDAETAPRIPVADALDLLGADGETRGWAACGAAH